MKSIKDATVFSSVGSKIKVFNWICPSCLKQLYTDGKKMFCKTCNIEYDESEEGIKKYCSDFEERELQETNSILPISNEIMSKAIHVLAKEKQP